VVELGASLNPRGELRTGLGSADQLDGARAQWLAVRVDHECGGQSTRAVAPLSRRNVLVSSTKRVCDDGTGSDSGASCWCRRLALGAIVSVKHAQRSVRETHLHRVKRVEGCCQPAMFTALILVGTMRTMTRESPGPSYARRSAPPYFLPILSAKE